MNMSMDKHLWVHNIPSMDRGYIVNRHACTILSITEILKAHFVVNFTTEFYMQ